MATAFSTTITTTAKETTEMTGFTEEPRSKVPQVGAVITTNSTQCDSDTEKVYSERGPVPLSAEPADVANSSCCRGAPCDSSKCLNTRSTPAYIEDTGSNTGGDAPVSRARANRKHTATRNQRESDSVNRRCFSGDTDFDTGEGYHSCNEHPLCPEDNFQKRIVGGKRIENHQIHQHAWQSEAVEVETDHEDGTRYQSLYQRENEGMLGGGNSNTKELPSRKQKATMKISNAKDRLRKRPEIQQKGCAQPRGKPQKNACVDVSAKRKHKISHGLSRTMNRAFLEPDYYMADDENDVVKGEKRKSFWARVFRGRRSTTKSNSISWKNLGMDSDASEEYSSSCEEQPWRKRIYERDKRGQQHEEYLTNKHSRGSEDCNKKSLQRVEVVKWCDAAYNTGNSDAPGNSENDHKDLSPMQPTKVNENKARNFDVSSENHRRGPPSYPYEGPAPSSKPRKDTIEIKIEDLKIQNREKSFDALADNCLEGSQLYPHLTVLTTSGQEQATVPQLTNESEKLSSPKQAEQPDESGVNVLLNSIESNPHDGPESRALPSKETKEKVLELTHKDQGTNRRKRRHEQADNTSQLHSQEPESKISKRHCIEEKGKDHEIILQFRKESKNRKGSKGKANRRAKHRQKTRRDNSEFWANLGLHTSFGSPTSSIVQCIEEKVKNRQITLQFRNESKIRKGSQGKANRRAKHRQKTRRDNSEFWANLGLHTLFGSPTSSIVQCIEEKVQDHKITLQMHKESKKRKGSQGKANRRAKHRQKTRRDNSEFSLGLHILFGSPTSSISTQDKKPSKKQHNSSEAGWTKNGPAAQKKRAYGRFQKRRFKSSKKKSAGLQSSSVSKSAFSVDSVQIQKFFIRFCIGLTFLGWRGVAERLFGLANKSYSGICWGRYHTKRAITAVKKFRRNPAKKKAVWQVVSAFLGKQRSDQRRFTRRKQKRVGSVKFRSLIKRKSKEVGRDFLPEKSSRSEVSSHDNSAAGSSAGTDTGTSAADSSDCQSEDDRVIVNEGCVEEGPNIELGQPPQGNNLDQKYEDESSRVGSFRRCSQLQHQAHNLARNGLYLTIFNLVKCSRCQRQQTVTDLQKNNTSHWHFPACPFNNIRSNAIVVQNHDWDDDVEADTPGRVSDDIGDPPGQQSVYIPPGDVRNETYRLSTFEQFPVTCPISRKSLAKSGFYFTGFYDRVKCFACGRTVERWESRDNPAELRWHKPDCAFPRGDSCGNVPINDLFNRLHTNPVTRQQQAQQQQEQVLTQTDPNTGAVIRTVRYPSDLPERIRRTGGTFQIGPGNSVIIQSGPGSRPNPAIHIGNENAPPPPRRWRMANVVSADHRRFVNNLYLNRELDRLTSFARWPVSRPNVSPASLAKTGFFYLGDMDRTQCFSCGGVLRNWTLEDDAQEEHRTHFPSCALVRRTENRNVPVPEEAESQEDRMRLYPCRYPANPHMRSEAARLETFDHRWPAGRIGATPAVIAQAGFFFLGERDRVKCFYCNGGLQNWEYDDMPWQEHAKWFPNCQFLLQTQGQVFVYRNLAMNPHLARPIIAKQEGATIDPAGAGEVARAQDIPPGGLPGPRQPSPPPTIIDPQEEMRKKKERIENIMKTSEICKYVLLMGFSQDVVRRLLEERIDAGNEANPDDIYESTSALLDDVMKKEEEMRREAEEEEARSQASMMSSASAYSMNLPSLTGSSIGPAPGSGRYNVSFYDEDEPMEGQELYESMNGPSTMSSITSTASVTAAKQVKQKEETSESLQEQLQKIEEERMCKICFSNTADMVFIPCSHMCCCMECTQAIRQCPVCRTKIEKAIKTYVN